ncbi:hypothetical protein ACFO3D_09450 [Virgibacillus kekensis]|uniref:Uncharacterized protein n=1 Tax=Virgibacillus kekensis TaxID=202261 RepID=A0ABV9DKC0_9BACI
MPLIAQQPYVKVKREVHSIEQIDIELNRMIYLYDDKVVTQHREFPVTDVLDMSYRQVGGDGGLLYLHTIKGVYTYTVKFSPTKFIEAFKVLKDN